MAWVMGKKSSLISILFFLFQIDASTMSEFFVHDPYGFPCHKVYHRRDRIHQNHGSHGRHLNRVRLFQHLFSDCTISFNPCNVFFIGGKTSHNAGIPAIFRYINISVWKFQDFSDFTWNQFSGMKKLEKCRFCNYRGSEFMIWMNFRFHKM